jgi:hypothetical protein
MEIMTLPHDTHHRKREKRRKGEKVKEKLEGE